METKERRRQEDREQLEYMKHILDEFAAKLNYQVQPVEQVGVVEPVHHSQESDQPPQPEHPRIQGYVSRKQAIMRGTGVLDLNALEQNLKRYTRQIKQCYETAMLKQGRPMSGRVSLRFQITAQGRTANILVNSQIHDIGMINCIKTTTARQQFPRVSAGVLVIEQPFVFSPRRDGQEPTGEGTINEGRTENVELIREVNRQGQPQAFAEQGDVVIEWVSIPAGSFQMGCSPGDGECQDDEKPRHQVTIRAFRMMKYEVTQGQYQQVIGSNPSNFSSCGTNCPVEQVAWSEAKVFCERVGGRLPTEAEWEYAARAGTTGVRYGDVDRVAWYIGNSGNKTHPVGQKQANAWGLYDMLGNVWEWCADWYDANYYSSSPTQYPVNTSSGSFRVVRGGGWFNDAWDARASYRFGFTPGYRGDYGGFRCAGDFVP